MIKVAVLERKRGKARSHRREGKGKSRKRKDSTGIHTKSYLDGERGDGDDLAGSGLLLELIAFGGKTAFRADRGGGEEEDN